MLPRKIYLDCASEFLDKEYSSEVFQTMLVALHLSEVTVKNLKAEAVLHNSQENTCARVSFLI